MTKKELKKKVIACPSCNKKPEGFSMISKLNEDFLARRLGDRTKKYYQLKCKCGQYTNGYEDKEMTINSWNDICKSAKEIKDKIA